MVRPPWPDAETQPRVRVADADAADEPSHTGSTRVIVDMSSATSPSVTGSLEKNARIPADLRRCWLDAGQDLARADLDVRRCSRNGPALLAEVASPPVVVPGGSGFAGQTAVAGCLLVVPGGGQAGPPSVDLDQAGFQ